MNKYIIVVSGKSDTGKTTVINNVWDMLPSFDGSGKTDFKFRSNARNSWDM